MMVTNSNLSGKPNSSDSQDRAEECQRAVEAIDAMASDLKRAVQDAASGGESFDQVERTIHKNGAPDGIPGDGAVRGPARRWRSR